MKGPRYLTHMLKLRYAQAPLGNFFASGLLRLGAKAAECGRGHDHRLKDRAWLRGDKRRPIRHAMEIRHESFRDPAFIDLLRKHDVALVCADTVDWRS